MSRKRLSMRKIKEVIRLRFACGLSDRQIATTIHLSKTTVHGYLDRVEKSGLQWAEILPLTEEELEQKLFPESLQPLSGRPMPDWAEIHLSLRKKGVTLQLLWEEYRAVHADGYSYSQFCFHYQESVQHLDLTMRRSHKAGEELFVDYSGQRLEVVDPKTGEVRPVEVFVGVLGASNYTYAEGTWTQNLPDWIGSHVRTLEFLGGVPALIIPDNLKSGVTKPWFYEPDINPTYHRFAEHYNTVVLPARVKKPRDKAKAEVAVQVVQRWIIARLRHRRFFSLAEVNEAIWELLEQLNNRPFRRLPGSRRSQFEELDKPALRPLPESRFVPEEWKRAKVHRVDYHVEFENHFYSAPYTLAGQEVEVRATGTTIEILRRGQRVTSHPRSLNKGGYSTLPEHRPPNHQFFDWSPERLRNWAAKHGESVEQVVASIIASCQHPEQGFRAALGIIRLSRQVGSDRLNLACQRALALGSPKYRSVWRILESGQEKRPLPADLPQTILPSHENIRGAEYYQQKEEEGDALPADH